MFGAGVVFCMFGIGSLVCGMGAGGGSDITAGLDLMLGLFGFAMIGIGSILILGGLTTGL